MCQTFIFILSSTTANSLDMLCTYKSYSALYFLNVMFCEYTQHCAMTDFTVNSICAQYGINSKSNIIISKPSPPHLFSVCNCFFISYRNLQPRHNPHLLISLHVSDTSGRWRCPPHTAGPCLEADKESDRGAITQLWLSLSSFSFWDETERKYKGGRVAYQLLFVLHKRDTLVKLPKRCFLLIP